ncbi:hypothetical protein Tco_0953536 [Tanacetum coccineum]|uniref:Uncharacterized protein n=1 Tax=Tanacetum coccineum TaxID=301880 RepID=A0ABQ5E2Z9_9ASTR
MHSLPWLACVQHELGLVMQTVPRTTYKGPSLLDEESDDGGSVKNKPVGHKLKLNLKAAKEATKKTVDLKPNPKTPVKPKSKEVDSVKSE